MYQIIALVRKYRFFLLFLVLQSIGLVLTLNYHSYQKNKFINASNAFNGSLTQKVFNVNRYFRLDKENEDLILENFRLRQELLRQELLSNRSEKSTHISFDLIATKVISNQYRNRNNTLLINTGQYDSVTREMGLINDKGVLGIVNHSSDHYASVMSILNPNVRIHAKLKGTDYFGTIFWDGGNYNEVSLEDIPRQANVREGDTIITGGKSIIFPEGIPIGRVRSISKKNNRYQKITIRLFNDMANISNAYVIRNKDQNELRILEKKAYE